MKSRCGIILWGPFPFLAPCFHNLVWFWDRLCNSDKEPQQQCNLRDPDNTSAYAFTFTTLVCNHKPAWIMVSAFESGIKSLCCYDTPTFCVWVARQPGLAVACAWSVPHIYVVHAYTLCSCTLILPMCNPAVIHRSRNVTTNTCYCLTSLVIHSLN